MSQQNINNAASVRKSIQSTDGRIASVNAPEKVAENKPAFKPDFSEAQKGPAIPSDRNHLVNPASAQEEAQSKYAVNLNFEMRDEDDYDSISFDLKNENSGEAINSSFALAENDQMSILTDRNPGAETENIIESTLLDLEGVSGMNFDLGVPREDSKSA